MVLMSLALSLDISSTAAMLPARDAIVSTTCACDGVLFCNGLDQYGIVRTVARKRVS